MILTNSVIDRVRAHDVQGAQPDDHRAELAGVHRRAVRAEAGRLREQTPTQDVGDLGPDDDAAFHGPGSGVLECAEAVSPRHREDRGRDVRPRLRDHVEGLYADPLGRSAVHEVGQGDRQVSARAFLLDATL